MSADVASHPAGKATEAEAIDRKWKLHQELTIEKVLEKQPQPQQPHQPHQQQQPVANQQQLQDPEEPSHQPPLEQHPDSQPNSSQPEVQTQIEDANAVEVARLRQQVLELQVQRVCCRSRVGLLDLEVQRRVGLRDCGGGLFLCFSRIATVWRKLKKSALKRVMPQKLLSFSSSSSSCCSCSICTTCRLTTPAPPLDLPAQP